MNVRIVACMITLVALASCKKTSDTSEPKGDSIERFGLAFRMPEGWIKRDPPVPRPGERNFVGDLYTPMAGSTSLLEFTPPHGWGAGDDSILFHCLIGDGAHGVAATDLQAVGENVFGPIGNAKSFAITRADVRKIHDVRAVVVEGHFLPDGDVEEIAAFFETAEWPATLFFRDKTPDFSKYADRVRESIASVHAGSGSPAVWEVPTPQDCKETRARRAAGEKDPIQWFSSGSEITVAPGTLFGIRVASAPMMCDMNFVASDHATLIKHESFVATEVRGDALTSRAVYKAGAVGDTTVGWQCIRAPDSGTSHVHIVAPGK